MRKKGHRNKSINMETGIWCLDLRDNSNIPYALHGWMSPMGIMELLEKDIQRSQIRRTDDIG